MRVVLSRAAVNDLAEIGRYVSLDSKRRALHVVRTLRAACRSLKNLPERSPEVRRLSGRPLRRLVAGNYSIFYVVADESVSVVRILHAARDIEHLLGDDLP